MTRLRVGLDVTPLLGARTGVGQYTVALVRALSALAEAPTVRLVPFTWRGAGGLPALAPPGVEVVTRRVPARLLRQLWLRVPLPPVEWIAGALDVFHATNFVLPPARHAAGVVTVHDLTFLRRPEWVTSATLDYRGLVPAGLRRAGAVCTVSEAVRGELLEAYPFVDPARVVVTPNGVDDACFDASPPDEATRRRLGLPASYVLFLGTREPRKGLDTLLAAWRSVVADRADVPPLVVAGAAGWGTQADLAAVPSVVTTGYVERRDVPALVAGAVCLAYPSRYEGFGLPPLETLAAGVPVVASDLPVLREVLGGHASYAAVGDPAALAAALLSALDAGPGDAAAVAARRAHARRFTWARCAEQTMAAYRLALT